MKGQFSSTEILTVFLSMYDIQWQYEYKNPIVIKACSTIKRSLTISIIALAHKTQFPNNTEPRIIITRPNKDIKGFKNMHIKSQTIKFHLKIFCVEYQMHKKFVCEV